MNTAGSLPTVGDVLLLIEVSDTTVEYDTRVKVPLYAQHGIPEVWVVDLSAEELVVYTAPAPTGYGSIRRYTKVDSVAASCVNSAPLPLSLIWRS